MAAVEGAQLLTLEFLTFETDYVGMVICMFQGPIYRAKI